MRFSKLLDDYFTQNFNEDVVVYYKQGGLTTAGGFAPRYANASTDDIVEQPDDFFIMYRKSGANVNHASIGARSDVMKRQDVRVTFNLYTPADQSPQRETEIESILDELFVDIELKDSDGFLYSDQVTPKTSARIDSNGANVWHDKQITYRYVYEYF